MSQGDSIYKSVRHDEIHFDYNELPRSVCVDNSDVTLSATFQCHYSGLLYASSSSPDFKCFTDAVSDACHISAGCLVTAYSTTVAVIHRNGDYFLFDSHSRNHLGLPAGNGTAVLLRFSSAEAVHHHIKQLHGIAANAVQCRKKFLSRHNEHCQFDVVGVSVNSVLDTCEVMSVSSADVCSSVSGVSSVRPLYSSVVGDVSDRASASVSVDISSQSCVSDDVRTVHVPVAQPTNNMSGVSVDSRLYASVVREVRDRGDVNSGVSRCTRSDFVRNCSSADRVFKQQHQSSVSHDKTVPSMKSLIQPHTCKQCGKTFKSKLRLNMHQVRVHNSGPVSNAETCLQCGKTFTKKSSLSLHHQRVHINGNVSTPISQADYYKQQRYGVLSSLVEDIPVVVDSDASSGQPPKKKSAKRTEFLRTKHNGPADDKKTAENSGTSFPVANQCCNLCGKLFVNLANHKKCSRKLVSNPQLSADHAEQNTVTTRTRKEPTRSRPTGNTRKESTKKNLEAELKQLKKKCIKNTRNSEKDPLLDKLTGYHNRLLSEVDNILTEKLSAEVKDVVNDLSQIDDVRRPFCWSQADEHKLNELNAQAKKLRTPEKWTWAAKEGTDQFEYNHKRMQYFVQHELQTVVKHCDKCKSTGILVGVDQIDSAYCHDCVVAENFRSKTVKSEKGKAWDLVRPKSMAYPQMEETGEYGNQDLPVLYPGDKAVLSPVHPVVTVRKNYLANKKLRQEFITLMQHVQQTWVMVLPRTDLKNRFVVIERTSKDHTRKHIVANPESVRAWLKFLVKNHPHFMKMEKNGELEISEQALSALQSQSELGEVLDDVEYVSESDNEDTSQSGMRSGTSSSDGVLQPELESGFSRSDVFTFDKFPQLYISDKDFLRIKQAGQIEIIKDHQERVPIYNVSAAIAFPYFYPRGEKSSRLW